ncbi:MAG: DNA translocase FtsK, partial [Anaerobutyricum soehngenii]
ERRSQKESAREKTDKTEPKKNLQDLKVNVPLFTSSDEVKRKDCVKELHPRIYPFTEEDGKTEPFQGKLDFSAFTFPDEIKESASSFEEEKNQKEKEEDVYEAPHKAKGGFHTSLPEEIKISGLKTSVKEPVENIVSEADAILEEDISVNLPDFSQSTMEAERINDEEKDKEKDKETTECKLIDSETANVEAMTNEVVDINNEAADNEENASEISNISDNEVIESEAKDNEIISDETVVKEIKAKEAAVPDRKKAEGKNYIFPPVTLLIKEQQTQSSGYEQYLKETALKLQQTLESFGVNVTITDISCGPSVTRYEMFPEQGTKVSKILSLTDDIKLNLAASDIRIEAPIPGKAAIGIEIPNKHNQTVHFRDLIESSTFEKFKSRLAFAVGKDIGGKTVVTDLAKMPHLLIAGATGSGKSVCINTLIMSILYKASPEEVKLIMVDPKMVELSIYNGIPHLLIPVVTDPKKASGALNWAVAEMTNRYKKFTETGVRNIEGYNKKVKELQKSGEIDPETIKKMPQIVIIIDELADLMMVAPGEVEDAIVRLSQLARAAGIHLVIATQRPSVNVITGLIKANVPSRIAFSVSSGVDSRTIIDMNGAEKLLGKGDMLFYPAGYSKPVRVQGAFISDSEISDVVEFLKENEDIAVYDTEVTEKIENKLNSAAISQEKDEYFEAAARFVIEKDKASIGMIQRMFKVGFNRAARIVDQLADAGIVGPEEGTKPRKVLMSSEQLEAYFEEYL